jgi:hypothetical protein
MGSSKVAAWLVITGTVIAGASGCGSGLDAAGAGPSSSTVASAPPAPAPTTSAAPCITSACIISDMNQSLVGMVAKDNAVTTKAVCKKSSLKVNPGQTWTAKCTLTYSDGLVAEGFANLVEATEKITFEPENIISGG